MGQMDGMVAIVTGASRGLGRAIAKELQEFMADKLYWNVVSGSPFFQVAQPWMKGYTFNSEFEVHYETVWLDK